MLLQAPFVIALAAAVSAFSVPSNAADGVYVAHPDKSSGSFIHFPLNNVVSPAARQTSKESLQNPPVARNEKVDFLSLNNIFNTSFRLKPVHPAAKGEKHLPTGIFNSTSYQNSLNATSPGPIVVRHIPYGLLNATILANDVENNVTGPLELIAKHLPAGILNSTSYENSLNATSTGSIIVSAKHIPYGLLNATILANDVENNVTGPLELIAKHLPAGILNSTSYGNSINGTGVEPVQVVIVGAKHLPEGILNTTSYVNSLNAAGIKVITVSEKHLSATILTTPSYTHSLEHISTRSSSPTCTNTYRLPLADIDLALSNLRNQVGASATMHAGQHYYSVVGDEVAYICNYSGTVSCDAEDVSEAHDAIAIACKVGRPGQVEVRDGMVVGFGGRSEGVCGGM